jgi:hypothetical protein
MGNITETSTFEEKMMEEYTNGINHFSEKYIKVKDKVSKLHLKIIQMQFEGKKTQLHQDEVSGSDLINKGWLEALNFFENELKNIQETS